MFHATRSRHRLIYRHRLMYEDGGVRNAMPSHAKFFPTAGLAGDVESEVTDLPVADDVVLAFEPQLAARA